MGAESRSLWSRVVQARWVPLGLSLLFVLLIKVPWVPSLNVFCTPFSQFSASRQLFSIGPIDCSYIITLHELVARHADFSHYPFTFGPWGFLYHGYHPKTYSAQIVAWLFLATVFWWTSVSIIRRGIKHPWAQAALAALLAIMAWRGYELDAGLFAFFSLLIAHYFHADRDRVSLRSTRTEEGTGIALTVAIALLSLVKFTFFLTAVPIILLITVDECLRKRWPRYLPVFIISMAFFWLLAHQPIASFFKFLRNSWEVSRNFEDGMSQRLSPEKALRWWVNVTPVFFVGVAASVVAVTAWINLRRQLVFGATATLALIYLFFVCLKASFIGVDTFHQFHATLLTLFTATLCLISLWKYCRTRIELGAAALTVILAIGLTTRDLWILSRNPITQVLVCLSSVPSSAGDAVRWLIGINPAAGAFEREMAQIRSEAPLPPITGSADLYPNYSIFLLANGLDYHPRPALQGYCAYSPSLEKLDADWLRSAEASEWIFFDIHPLSNRYPSLEDGLSWPELVTRYDITGESIEHLSSGFADGYLILHKSAHPRTYSLAPIAQTQATFRQPVTIPDAPGRAVWVEMEINHSLAGSLLATTYKCPPLWLNVAGADGVYVRFRLPGQMAKAGFLLSPLIRNRASFAKFAKPDWSQILGRAKLSSLQITAGDDAASQRYFNDRIVIRFYSLNFARTEK